MPTKAEILEERRRNRDGFDVTCTIGRVVFGEGELSPHEAAMLLIARHDAPGTYSFPSEQPGTVEVTVNYIGE
jgi:hypothetical protein